MDKEMPCYCTFCKKEVRVKDAVVMRLRRQFGGSRFRGGPKLMCPSCGGGLVSHAKFSAKKGATLAAGVFQAGNNKETLVS